MNELSDLILEVAKKEDVKELVSLEKICFREDAFSKKQITYLVTKAIGEFILIRKDKKIIAYLIISKRKNSKKIRIYSIAIAPEARGQGLAKTLMNYVEKLCVRESKDKISLEVSKDNLPAINLYRSLGYQILGEKPNYYANGNSALLMLKRILNS